MNLRAWNALLAVILITVAGVASAGDDSKTKKAKPSKPSAKKVAAKPKDESGESKIFEEIDRVRALASKIKIDGKRADWKDIPAINAPRGDAKGDGSRDIVRVSVAPREKDWTVMIATASKPSRDEGAFWFDIDFKGFESFDVQVGLVRYGGCIINIYDNGSFVRSERRQGIQWAVGDVVEARIPFEVVADLFPPESAEMLIGDKVRSWVRIVPFSLIGGKKGRTDEGIAVASYRLIETPFALDPPRERSEKAERAVDLPMKGKWYLGQGPFGNWSHQDTYAYDLFRMDATHHSSKPADSPRLEDYLDWGAEVFAPIGGRVLRADSSNADHPPTRGAPVSGGDVNHVYLDLGRNQALWFGHFRQGSVSVVEGNRVKAGTKLGEVGNSGASSWPHLHLALFKMPEGRKTIPLALSNVRVSLNLIDDDPWTREIKRWEPVEGFFVESLKDAAK